MKKIETWLKCWGRWSNVEECKGFPRKSAGICGADIKLDNLKNFSLSEDMAIEIDNAITKLSKHNDRLLNVAKLVYVHKLQKKDVGLALHISKAQVNNDLSCVKAYVAGAIEAKDISILF